MVHITAAVRFQLLYGSYSSCCMVHVPTGCLVHIRAAVCFIFQLPYGSYYSCCMVHHLLYGSSCCMVHIPAAVLFIFYLLYGSYSSCCMVHIPTAVWFILQLLYGSYSSCWAAVRFLFQLLCGTYSNWVIGCCCCGLYFRCCIVYVYLYGFPANHSVLIPPSSKPEFDLIWFGDLGKRIVSNFSLCSISSA